MLYLCSWGPVTEKAEGLVSPGVVKVRPAGQIRPADAHCPARGVVNQQQLASNFPCRNQT